MSSVLVIDDSSVARERLAAVLRAQGNQVFEAPNGREGMEKVESHRPDCIILDLLMPEMSGVEVLRALKERGVATPVVVVSADIQETTKRECMELGAIAFVNKPLNESELTGIIQGIGCPK